MESLYYAVERCWDGWHAHPLDGPDDDDHRFATREAAVAWCRAHGHIPREHEPTPAYGIEITESW